jgi:hypothetical protein
VAAASRVFTSFVAGHAEEEGSTLCDPQRRIHGFLFVPPDGRGSAGITGITSSTNFA